MTITVNNVQLIVDEAMLASNDPDEVGAFAADLQLSARVGGVGHYASRRHNRLQHDTGSGPGRVLHDRPNTTDLSFVASGGSPGVPPTNFPVGGTNGIDSA
jgi:hypothetical protein